MIGMNHLQLPLTQDQIQNLDPDEFYALSGVLYTARDASHKKLMELLKRNKELPFPIEGQAFFYMGPSPARPGKIVGAAGPTTSQRMDPYTPALMDKGLIVTIGKGGRSESVEKAIRDHKSVYFGTVGGAGAYLSKCIKKMEVVAFPELGPEAIYRLEVEDLPVIPLIK